MVGIFTLPRRIGTWFLLIASVIGLIYNIDPTNQGFGSTFVPILKYLPYCLAFASCVLFFISGNYNINFLTFFLLIFVFLIISGSCYSLIIMDFEIEETYLGRALGGFVLIAFYMMAYHYEEMTFFLKRFFYVFLFCSLIMVIIVTLFRLNVAYTDLTQMFQTSVIMFLGSSVLVFFLLQVKTWKYILALIYILGALLVVKTTAILSCTLTGLFILIIYIKNPQNYSKKAFRTLVVLKGLTILIIGTLISTTGMLIYKIIDQRVMDRDTIVRKLTMRLRLQEFYDQPFGGNFFTGSPLVDVGSLHIPSHSDILDLLSLGGTLSIFLFFFPVLFLLKKNILQAGTNFTDLRAWFAFVIAMMLEIMFINPILGLPRLGFIFWMSLGLLANGNKISLND